MQQATARARIWPYVLILCLAFITFVLALVPVSLVWERIRTPQMELQSNGLQGTLWQGRADWVEWQAHSVQAVRWSFHPWGLLRGIWEYQVELQYEGAPVTGLIGLGPDGKIRGRDLQTQVLLQNMQALTDQMDIPAALQGDLQIEITRLIMSDKWPDALQGRLALNSLGIVGLAELGDWQGQLSQADNRHIRLQFAPASDDLLQGTGELILTPTKTWNLTLKIRPMQAEGESGALIGLLDADSQGYIKLTQRGSWH